MQTSPISVLKKYNFSILCIHLFAKDTSRTILELLEISVFLYGTDVAILNGLYYPIHNFSTFLCDVWHCKLHTSVDITKGRKKKKKGREKILIKGIKQRKIEDTKKEKF